MLNNFNVGEWKFHIEWNDDRKMLYQIINRIGMSINNDN